MAHAVNFDRKMILLACWLAHELDTKGPEGFFLTF
jgi:hypothetical protein